MTRALIVDKKTDETGTNDAVTVEIRSVGEEFLGDGDTIIAVSHSALNYKDAMALEGNKGVARTFPLVPGIDAIGTIESTTADGFSEDDLVVLNGAGIGEFRHGGYQDRVRVDSSSLIAAPEGWTAEDLAAVGTAGYTAALSVLGLQDQGVKPEDGEILVTGATGGVGSVTLMLLKKLGYSTVASTGRKAELEDYLIGLGAGRVIDRAELSEKGKPLQKATYAGAIDCVGSTTLANALAQVTWGGTVTACGLAQGADLKTTVLPFILRGVKLVGINSVDAPRELRQRAYDLLAEHLDLAALHELTQTVTLDEVAEAGKSLFAGGIHGRTIVQL
ncbi:MDR family oxidoreductase [uncultured Corynebacterium sp.]|uniref:MDR family oxidoreductase n=1 Tax=uncultured Corynebacterium sp. TaxID=159447 RepID=UPI00260491C1|nr:MDR family oxidoreductase [uncultured Corynebacterium sp.]